MAEINVHTKNRVLVDTDHGFIVDSWDELRGGHFGGDGLVRKRHRFRSWLFKRNDFEGKVRMTLESAL